MDKQAGERTQSLIWFEDLSKEAVPEVGGKNASLGEMVAKLGAQGIRVPPGFATTAEAWRRYIGANRPRP
ncbi:PEP/pyruvate-binding domain-containing protein [Mangrovicoccus ximenensis]|uniref:PEP/pyruvate-binding domain-containing protein n=1 Tax=Mangrovicoccus ximenensis TaxID=1911570 RepID=UPI000D350A7D|nr:PEP/pyruvate-binding domain-containing protein [Mangrovicoccus ximenensis]